MRFAVISGHRWSCGQIIESENQAAAMVIAGITIEEYCDSLDAANDRAVAIAHERGWA